MASGALTEYERRRLENIRRNDEMLGALMLQRRAADLSTSIKRSNPPKPSPSRKKPKQEPDSPVVIRRSLRARGVRPVESSPDALPSPQPPSSPVTPARRRGLIRIEEVSSKGKDSDQKFIDTVLGMEDDLPLDAAKGLAVQTVEKWDPTPEMVLREDNVNRFLPGRILSVNFFPFRDRTVVAAGDKLGNVGFWDVDCEEEHRDGVYVYTPHSSPVSGILFPPNSLSKIFTSSYDGFIRLMDIQKETFNMIYSSERNIFSISQPTKSPRSLYFGEGYGDLSIWDDRVGKILNSWELHDSRVNTIDFNPANDNLMATSSTDGTACIWDLRSMKREKPEAYKRIQHMKAVHSAYFSPSGGSLATTSIDDHVRILSGINFNDLSVIAHYNQTGRWISSFRAIWGWDDDHLFLGNMGRAIDVISAANKTTVSLQSPCMSAIPCRFAAHPYKLGSLACATAGGQVYLWTKK